MEKKRKVMVIGLDGATFDLIKPWMEESHLPNLKRLMETGTHGLLESTMPPVTAPAWPSMITGKNPAGHGCFDFTKQVDKTTGDVGIVSSQSIRSQTLWSLLSDAGKRVGIVNVPVTYPPQKVNGFMISGMLSPNNIGFSYPKGLIEEMAREFRPYRVDIVESFRDKKKKDLLDDILALTKEREESALWLMKNKSWDFFMVVFKATDYATHFFWKYMDKNHPQYEGDNNGFNDAILQCYKRVDEAVGKLAKEAGQGAYIFLVSDHGAGPLHKSVNLNIFLKKKGFIVMKKTFGTMLKRAMFRLGLVPDQVYRILEMFHMDKIVVRKSRKHVTKTLSTKFLSFDDVDWDGTKAFSRGYLGKIYINAKGDEYYKVRQQVIDALFEMRDPQTGKKIVTKIVKKEDAYSGKFIDEAPDIIVIMQDFRYISYPLFASSNSLITHQIAMRSGHHTLHGIFCAAGPDIKPSQELQGLRIIDICPTILHLFGTQVPEDMDGKVLREIFKKDSEVYKQKPLYRSPSRTDEMDKVNIRIKELKRTDKI